LIETLLVAKAHLRVPESAGLYCTPCTGRVSPVRWCGASYSRIVEKRGMARPGPVKFTKAETKAEMKSFLALLRPQFACSVLGLRLKVMA
jgi:hypothetical protein